MKISRARFSFPSKGLTPAPPSHQPLSSSYEDISNPKLPIQPLQKPTHFLLIRLHPSTHTRLLRLLALRTRHRLLLLLLLLPLHRLLRQFRIRLHLRRRRLIRLRVQAPVVPAYARILGLVLVLAVLPLLLGVVAWGWGLLAGRTG